MQRLSRKTETLLHSRGVPRTVKKEEPVPASRTIRAAYAPMSRDSASGAPQSGQIALARVSGLGERRLLPSGALGPTSGLRVVTPALLSDDCQKPSRLPVGAHWPRHLDTFRFSPRLTRTRVGRSPSEPTETAVLWEAKHRTLCSFFPVKTCSYGQGNKEYVINLRERVFVGNTTFLTCGI